MAETKVAFPSVAYASAIDAKVQRAFAVAAALELIAARIANNTNGRILEHDIQHLSSYADEIQKALEVK